MSKKERKIGAQTERVAGDYLFERGEMTDSQFMDMRTRIKSEAMLKALVFYGILKEGLNSDDAGNIKDMIERMLIGEGGLGRVEAVTILRQNFPRVREVDKGTDDMEQYVRDARARDAL